MNRFRNKRFVLFFFCFPLLLECSIVQGCCQMGSKESSRIHCGGGRFEAQRKEEFFEGTELVMQLGCEPRSYIQITG